MKKYILNRNLLRIFGIILFVILWHIISFILGDNTFIFPSPKNTIIEVMHMLKSEYVYKCIFQTMIRMVSGFAISFILAMIFGTIAGNSRTIEEIINPTMTIIKSIPTAALIYTFLVLVGARITPMFIVILVSFPILYESVLGGIKSTPIEILESSRIDAASNFYTIIKIRIPLAIRYIVIGVVSSFSLSLKIEIMAEVITGYTRLGIGSAILAAQRSDPTNMVPVFAYSFIAIVLMLLFDFLMSLIKQSINSV